MDKNEKKLSEERRKLIQEFIKSNDLKINRRHTRSNKGFI